MAMFITYFYISNKFTYLWKNSNQKFGFSASYMKLSCFFLNDILNRMREKQKILDQIDDVVVVGEFVEFS